MSVDFKILCTRINLISHPMNLLNYTCIFFKIAFSVSSIYNSILNVSLILYIKFSVL